MCFVLPVPKSCSNRHEARAVRGLRGGACRGIRAGYPLLPLLLAGEFACGTATGRNGVCTLLEYA